MLGHDSALTKSRYLLLIHRHEQGRPILHFRDSVASLAYACWLVSLVMITQVYL